MNVPVKKIRKVEKRIRDLKIAIERNREVLGKLENEVYRSEKELIELKKVK